MYLWGTCLSAPSTYVEDCLFTLLANIFLVFYSLIADGVVAQGV